MNAQHAEVLAYYQATRKDYRNLWTSWNEMAVHFGHYDESATGHGAAVLRMNEVVADAAGITVSDRVLDAGCGYGGSATWLAAERRCRVTGITLVPFQALEGMQRARQLGLADRVSLMQADYTCLPFADSSFSVFWALESLVHTRDRAEVLSEAYRVLQPGGRLVFAECLLRGAPALGPEEQAYLQPALDGWAMPALYSVDSHRRMLAAAGFEDIAFEDRTASVRPSLRRLRRLCALAMPGARLLQRCGLFNDRRVANVAGSLRLAQALERELWHYGIFTARRPA